MRFDGCIDDVCLGLFRCCLGRCLVEIAVCLEMEFRSDMESVDDLRLIFVAPK